MKLFLSRTKNNASRWLGRAEPMSQALLIYNRPVGLDIPITCSRTHSRHKKKLDKQYFRCFNCFLKRCFASLHSIAERFLSKRSTITFMDTVLIAQLFHYARWSHFAINKNCDVNYSFYEYFRNFLRLIAILGDLITWKNRLRFEEEKEKRLPKISFHFMGSQSALASVEVHFLMLVLFMAN